jgi:hypothetical protein
VVPPPVWWKGVKTKCVETGMQDDDVTTVADDDTTCIQYVHKRATENKTVHLGLATIRVCVDLHVRVLFLVI